jgi:DNA-binding transcriptional LysR family regulator
MDRFDDLHTFIIVAELQSIRQAADQLNRAPSAVSRRLKDLEERLQTQLLTRTTRQVILTNAGERFLTRARRVLQELEEAEASASSDSVSASGVLKVTMPQSFGLAHVVPAMSEFITKNPAMRIDADLNDRVIDLASNHMDMALRIGHLDDTTLRGRLLCPIHHVVAASPDFWKTHGIPKTPQKLNGMPALCYSNTPLPQSWSWSNDRGNSGQVIVKPIHHATSGDALVYAAKQGLGVIRLPTFLTNQAIEDGELQPVLLPTNWGVAGLYALYPETSFLPSRTRLFIDFLADRFGHEPEWDECLRQHLKRIGKAPSIHGLFG